MAEEVIARLMSGRSLAGLDLDEFEGRTDLRYLPVPIPERLKRFEAHGWFVEMLGNLVTFRDARLAKLDLSGALLQSLRFFDTAISDCRFDRANCRDWRLWNTTVTGCSFAGADLRDAAVGTWHDGRRNEWRRVDFTAADFRVIVSAAALYEDCEFADAKLAGVRFAQCALVRCHFAGPLTSVVFDERKLRDSATPHPLVDVDFAEARFDDVEFMGCRLDRVVLPVDPDVRLVRHWRCVVEHGLTLVDGDESRGARILRAVLQNTLRGMRGADEDTLLNRRDYQDPEELAELAERVFAEAEAKCGR